MPVMFYLPQIFILVESNSGEHNGTSEEFSTPKSNINSRIIT